MSRLSSISALAAFAVAAALAFAGCSESACEKAENSGKATHACYVENKKAEDELKEAEYGSLEGAEEAERQDEIEEEVEEVEEVLKREQAEETAQTLRELEGR
jgi:basic membrane lipoprotein Med (substrate-binding protein (PBP1-ABC) superfamily)